MTLDELISQATTLLTRNGSNRLDASDIRTVVLNVIAFFATQIGGIIPEWTIDQTFQTDGSDDGLFCRYNDTNGKSRLFKTKVDDNTGNAPPTNPAITENAYWEEISASAGAAIPEWAPGVYGPGLVIVFHNHSTQGRGLYILLEPARPFESADIETEMDAGAWERIGDMNQFEVSTAGANITQDFKNKQKVNFYNVVVFNAHKTILYSNAGVAHEGVLFLHLTTDNELTFPAGTKMAGQGIWTPGTLKWQCPLTGIYKFTQHKIGGTWYIEASLAFL